MAESTRIKYNAAGKPIGAEGVDVRNQSRYKSKKEQDEETDWSAYKKEKNLSFAAQKDQAFTDWRKKKNPPTGWGQP